MKFVVSFDETRMKDSSVTRSAARHVRCRRQRNQSLLASTRDDQLSAGLSDHAYTS